MVSKFKNTDVSAAEEFKDYPLVAIASSTQNTKSVIQLVKHVPPNTGMAFIYFQQLDKKCERDLLMRLTGSTKMKVHLGETGMILQPDNLIVVPANKVPVIKKGVVTLMPLESNTPISLLIDRFFISLAEQQGRCPVAILLSETAAGGANGLKTIQMAGGLTFSQNHVPKPNSSPHWAEAENTFDRVLTPKEIAKQLEHLSKQAHLFNSLKSKGQEPSIETQKEISYIIQFIKRSTGINFEHYKINSINRRISRRILLHNLSSLREYIKYLQQHADEAKLLCNDLLISVTAFFRDGVAMDFLKTILLPQVLIQKPSNLRIWVPACSTGEEAYTLAMIIMESLGDNAVKIPLQIFATDISEAAINKARSGAYSTSDVANISPERLKRFFIYSNGSYRIIKTIRKICIFSVHNIFKDPPFSKLTMISCCNFLIYLDTVLQKKVLNTFYQALNENGYLLLGKSESAGIATNLFSSINKKVKVYIRKKTDESAKVNDLPFHEMVRKGNMNKFKPPVKEMSRASDIETITNNIFIKHYSPPSLVIDLDLEVVQFRGDIKFFLEPVSSRASLNVLSLVNFSLTVELRRAVTKCIKTGKAVKTSAIKTKLRGRLLEVTIEVLPLEIPGNERLLLVIFSELIEKESDVKPTDKRVKQLQNELSALREDMRSILEEHETANEELQTANEEILSSNEELQSINEELETSKEEIESTNEDLLSINSELIAKNEQLAESKTYTEVVIASIREAVVILDSGLHVKSANKAFYRIFKLKEEQVEGNIIYEIGGDEWNIPQLKGLLEKLKGKNAQSKGIVITHTFPQLGEKALIVDARNIIQQSNHEQTILLSIEDISAHRKIERLVAEREAWFRNMSDNVPIMIWVAGTNRQFTHVNKTWLKYTGKTLKQEINNGWLDDLHPDDMAQYIKIYNESFDIVKPFRIEFRMRRHDGVFRWQLNSAVPTYSSSGEFIGFTGSCIEIHLEKLMNTELERRVEERTSQLQQANNNLERSNNELEQFAYAASHDLQEPLRKILTFSDQLEEQYIEQLPLEGKEYVAKIIASSERMTQLIDDLLDFSQITQSQNGFVETDLNVVLQELLVDFELTIKEKKAEVLKTAPLPVLKANQLQMQQLFQNLLSNSLKFSLKDRKPIISISSRKLSSEELNDICNQRLHKSKVHYEIVFRDNGIGFNQEYAEQAFTIFQRLHDRSLYPGTGIGLALCRKIVDSHNGILTVQSEENKGTTFFIIIPDNVSDISHS